MDEFKLHARERKFIVREFSYNEADLAAGKNEITKLVTDKKKQFVSLFLIHTFFCSFTIIGKEEGTWEPRTLRFASLLEQGNEHIKYFVSSYVNETYNFYIYSRLRTLVLQRHDGFKRIFFI